MPGGRLITVEVGSRGIGTCDETVVIGIIRDIVSRKRIGALQRESEERFRNVANSTMDAIISTDEEANIVFWNNAAGRIFGYGDSEVMGKPITILMSPLARDEFTLTMDAHKASKASGILDRVIRFTAVRKDGTELPIEMSMSSWTQGGRVMFSAVLRDITERKNSEDALSYKNKELSIISSIAAMINRSSSIEEILEGTLIGSLELLEMDAGAIYLSDAADRSQLVLRAFVPRTEIGLDAEPRKAVRADASLNTEAVLCYANGGTGLFQEIFEGKTATVIVPIMLKGFAIGFMAFYSGRPASTVTADMSNLLSIGSQIGIAIDNHMLLRTLRATSNYLAEVINESPDAILTSDARGYIVSSNKRAARLLQYDMAEMSGMNVKQLLPPGAAPLTLAVERSYVRDFMRKDGTTITLNISTSHFESGEVAAGFIISLKDLSEIAGLKIVPIVENAIEGARKYHFEKGLLYLMDKSKGIDCMDVFEDQVKHNIQGLCITRHSPRRIRETYGLEKTPVIWLNGSDMASGEHCIKPDNLTGLGATIYKFLSEANDGIVLLDGLEYLVARNSFDSVLKFLHLLNDRVMVSNCVVLFCIDPLTFEPRQFHLLLTEMQEFKE